MSNEPGLVPELVVTDYEASRRFWCDLVGFSLRYVGLRKDSATLSWVTRT